VQNALTACAVHNQGDDQVPSSISRRALLRAGLAAPLMAGCQSLMPAIAVPDFSGPGSINYLPYVKASERRGGFVRNIHMTNVSATRMFGFGNRAGERA
jgi:hypothetical protein